MSASSAWVLPGVGTLPALGSQLGIPAGKPVQPSPWLDVKAAGADRARRRVKHPRRGQPPPDPLLSVDQAADYLGISPGTLRNWLSMRRLAFVKVGRLTKLSKAVLDRFIADHTVQAVANQGQRS